MMNAVALRMGCIDAPAAKALSALGERVRQSAARTASSGIEEISIASMTPDGAGRTVAISYSLGSTEQRLEQAVGDLLPLSGDDTALLSTFNSSDLLFHWEDQLVPSERGPAVPVYAAVPLDPLAAEQLKTLIADMIRDHKSGLIERACAVGYYREAMAMARDECGKPWYLLYLELRVADYATLVARLMAYARTPFNVWWTPKYIELVGHKLRGNAVSQPLLRWNAAGK